MLIVTPEITLAVKWALERNENTQISKENILACIENLESVLTDKSFGGFSPTRSQINYLAGSVSSPTKFMPMPNIWTENSAG